MNVMVRKGKFLNLKVTALKTKSDFKKSVVNKQNSLTRNKIKSQKISFKNKIY